MDGQGSLKLTFVDTHGNPLNDTVNVTLQHTQLMSAGAQESNFNATKPLQINGLDSTQGGVYRMLVEPSKYQVISQFERINDGQTTEETLIFPVDPGKVRQVDFPVYGALPEDLQTFLENSNIDEDPFRGLKGAALYEAVANIPKAGMFNLYSKMQHTTFDNGRNVFTYMLSLASVAGDRFFALVKPDLHDETEKSGLFHSVADALHSPKPGYSPVDSYKTGDHYGNLQLTFSQNAQKAYMVDADIDDAQGIEHIFQVVRNAAKGPTNPYDIHEILLVDQKIDPGYTIEV
jgi:hypothetical protein